MVLVHQITLRQLPEKLFKKHNVVIGAQRSLNLFTADIKGEIFVLTAKNLNDSLKHAAESVKSGKNVALLSTGDPGFSGLIAYCSGKRSYLTTADINVVPGVSSIQACAATLNISWDNACLFTFHEGNVTDEEKEKLVSCR